MPPSGTRSNTTRTRPLIVEALEDRRMLDGVSAPEFAERLDQAGVRTLALGPDMIRAVTNLMVEKEDIPQALNIIREIMTTYL